MKDLFTNFDAVGRDEWLNQIEKDLKGKPFEILSSKPEPDLQIDACHHKEDLQSTPANAGNRSLHKSTNAWSIREAFTTENTSGETILEALNDGIDAVGISVNDPDSYTRLSKGIAFEYIHSDVSFTSKETAMAFTPHKNTCLNFDVIGLNAQQGNHSNNLEDFAAFYAQHPTNKVVFADGSIYGSSGASTIQELGMTLAHLNEYVQFLVNKGESLKTINQKIVVILSVNENYFVNIAKFRVIRNLINLMFKAYDETYSPAPVTLYAQTSIRHYAVNDKNNNALRQTTQAMSAVIGGCDVLTVDYAKSGNSTEVSRFRRIAKNIQLILKEEAYLDKVIDPAGGSYYLESLSDQLLKKSWAIFLEIEAAGGILKALEQNIVQDKIELNRAALINDLLSGDRTFLGVNKYPNSMEEWTETKAKDSQHQETSFKSLDAFRLENAYTKTTAENE